MSNPAPVSAGDSPAPSPPPALAWRFLRLCWIVALALALSFLGLLSAATSAPVIRESLGPLVWEHRVVSTTAIVVTLAVAVLAPIGVLILCNRRGWLRWSQLVALSALVLVAVVYLMWDEPTVRRPLTMDELSPSLAGDEATFQIFLRYAKNSPAATAFKPPPEQLAVARATGDIAAHPEKFAAFLREHRADVESGWAELAPVRAWWNELAAHARIGDLTPPDPLSPILAFQPIRTYAQYATAYAGLQALDGRGDEALATLANLYDVARKMEPNSRTLVRAMIAKVIQKMALQTAGFVLDHATVSPVARAAFLAEIAAATGGPPGARRLILIEYAYFQPSLALFVGGKPVVAESPATASANARLLARGTQFLGRIVINPIATQNLVGDRYYQLATLAEERRLGELEASKAPINREFLGGYHVKNVGGRLIADMAMPALSKVMKSYWDTDDLRIALITRLKA